MTEERLDALDDATARAAAETLTRDALWRNPLPLAGDCEHELQLLPIIEPRFTVTCRKCGGLDIEASRAIGSARPGAREYLILPNSTVRPLKDPPNREWAIRHPNGKITVRIDGHAFPGRRSAEEARAEAGRLDCDTCDGGTHTLVYRDRQPWREAP